MAYRPRGKASVDPEYPRSFAICARCGALYNGYKLDWQYQWQGQKLMNKRLQVCEDCRDRPSQFLRQIVIPPDPPAIIQPRMEPYAIDEAPGSYVPTYARQIFTTPGDSFFFMPIWATKVRMGVYAGGAVNTISVLDGGGGGSYAETTISISGSPTIYLHVAAAADQSWAQIGVNAPPTDPAKGCLAIPGINRHGGLASGCVGLIAFDGGDGSASGYGGGGGGAAAGPTGPGGWGSKGGIFSLAGGGGGGGGANGGASALNIGAQSTGAPGGAAAGPGGLGGVLSTLTGGSGSNGSGGGGGYGLALNVGAGGPGGAGTEVDGVHGAGGGGGASGYSTTGPLMAGGNGGLYGGGGGGGGLSQGLPASGLVFLVFS